MSTETQYGASAYMTFAGKELVLNAVLSSEGNTFSVEMKDFTLGHLITEIVRTMKPGYVLDIPSPWNSILDHKIPSFSLILKIPKQGKTEFGISIDPQIDNAILKISKLTVFARSIRDVNINMEGSVLKYNLSKLFNDGKGVNLLGADGLPEVPAPAGNFELNFLGIGQHLELKNAAQYNHVKDALDAMLTAFDLSQVDVVPKFTELLSFNNNSQWLFGVDAKLMNTVAIKAVFNDPVLYGLYLGLSGDKAKALAGLEFEILYKKITEDIGVYQVELKLPDAIRNMEFGAVSITLPVIGISIYTNGNFKIDLGFPYNQDWNRSAAVQVFPFIGQGGFYFALLNGSTSTTVPKTEYGYFNPVLEFGIGLNIGLGKTFNKGILAAGLTLSFFGIVEGTLAWFKGHEDLPAPDPKLPDFYYKLNGTFGIIGHIFGEINFAIISARLDIIVYAQINVTIEAEQPILLSFTAGVTLKLTVKINLGLFKINIHLSFSTSITESFTLGSAKASQWNPGKKMVRNKTRFTARPLFAAQDSPNILMNWDNLFTTGAPQQVDVAFVPMFSVSEEGGTRSVAGISGLFLENNIGISKEILSGNIIDKHAFETASLMPFDKLCISILSWAIRASQADQTVSFEAFLKQTVSAKTIKDILYALNHPEDPDGQAPFTYNQIKGLIESLFVLNIEDPKRKNTNQELHLTVFPMIPQLFKTVTGDTVPVDFSTYNEIGEEYLQKIMELIQQFSPQNGISAEVRTAEVTQSMATFIFRDYFFLIAKSLLQSASDVFDLYTYVIPEGATLQKIASQFATKPADLAETNKAATGIFNKTNIIIPGAPINLDAGNTFQSIQSLHEYTISAQEWNSAFARLNQEVKMFIPGQKIAVSPDSGATDIIQEGDTLDLIAKRHEGLSIENIVSYNFTNAEILSGFTQVTLPDFYHAIADDTTTFLSLAGIYGILIADLAAANADNTGLLLPKGSMLVQRVPQMRVSALLNAVYQKDYFREAGGSASRFTLHGMRLPEDVSPLAELNGLYTLSGQQDLLPKFETKEDEYAIQLSKTATPSTGEDPLPWVLFNGEKYEPSESEEQTLAVFDYPLYAEQKELIYEFQSVAFEPTILNGPAPLTLYKDQARTFSFSNPITWQEAGNPSAPEIWNFSNSLAAISFRNPVIMLSTAVQSPDKRTVTPLPADSYDYRTIVPMNIRKINVRESGIDKNAFELFGTDATGIDTLTSLLQTKKFKDKIQSIQILYASDPANDEARALRSDENPLLLLINTNLSTESNPDKRKFGAVKSPKITNTPADIFVRRLWQASIVKTGGYYLYYDNQGESSLPDSIFGSNGEAEIYLVICYKPDMPGTIQPYMNCAVVNEHIDTSQTILFGEWQVNTSEDHNTLLREGKLIRNTVLKPGNAGFELERKNPDVKFEVSEDIIPSPEYDLEIQYNLLNFKILDKDGKKVSESVLPVASSEDTATQDILPEAPWKYTRTLPVSSIKTIDPSGTAPGSPYLGLGQTAYMGFNWQDNYGNIIQTPVPNLPYKILYFDQLEGPNSWPCLTLEYWFAKPVAQQDNFNLSFVFQPGEKYGFNPESEKVQEQRQQVIDQAQKDLEKYTAIAYQVAEKDLQITYVCTLDPNTVYPPTPAGKDQLKAHVTNYLHQAMTWISEFIADPDKYNQFGLKDQGFRYSEDYSAVIPASNTLDIFDLSVTVSLARDKNLIDPQFILDLSKDLFVEGIQSVSVGAKPKSGNISSETKEGDKENKTLALREFASHFEEAFGDIQLKLATAYVKGDASSLTTSKEEELCVVRFKKYGTEGNGMAYNIDFGNAAYFAPQPLANQLVSMDSVEIYPYEHYTDPTHPDNKVLTAYNGIDTESWAQDFLQSLEDVFAPVNSLPIAMIDRMNGKEEGKGILDKLLASKEKLADAISYQTISILGNNPSSDGLKAAREKLRQQLLIQLYNGYMVNAVVQYPTAVNSPYPDNMQPIAPNLYGQPFVPGDADENTSYTFSAGKIPLSHEGTTSKDGKSFLTFTFGTQNPTLDSSISIPVDYQITHLETDISKLDTDAEKTENYSLSKWLTFILPIRAQQASGELVKSHIPVPIRQYPPLPVFGSQVFRANPGEPIMPTLESVKLIDYFFDYTLDAFVAQDIYHVEVSFNASAESVSTLHIEDIEPLRLQLFRKMAQYMAVYPQFMDEFRTKLPEVDGKIDSDELKRLTLLLDQYTSIVADVSTSWYNAFHPNLFMKKLAPSVEVVKAVFKVKEGESETNDLFQLKLSEWSVMSGDTPVNYVAFPTVELPGWTAEPSVYDLKQKTYAPLNGQDPALFAEVSLLYFRMEGETKTYLTADEGKKIRNRTVNFTDLSVLQIQNGLAGLYVERNADLSGVVPPIATNKQFIYSTPVRRFNNPITPSIHVAQEFPLDVPAPADKRLIDYLKSLLRGLMSTPDGKIVPVSLKILVKYSYQQELFPVTLPVLLLPVTVFDENDINNESDTGISALNEGILNWFSLFDPVREQGKLSFGVTFYTSMEDSNLPLLTLDQLTIRTANISDLPESIAK